MGQMTYQLQSEHLAYAYALEHYQQEGNVKMLNKLKAAAPTLSMPLPRAYDALRDDYMHAAGIGTTRDMASVVTGVFVPSWFSCEFTLREKINLWRGKFFSMRLLRNTAFATDLMQQLAELNLPVYFFSGAYDYTCNYALSRSYLEKLTAPLKGFYVFEQSAHTPIFEEPEKVRMILREDVLAGKNGLADVT